MADAHSISKENLGRTTSCYVGHVQCYGAMLRRKGATTRCIAHRSAISLNWVWPIPKSQSPTLPSSAISSRRHCSVRKNPCPLCKMLAKTLPLCLGVRKENRHRHRDTTPSCILLCTLHQHAACKLVYLARRHCVACAWK